jgi:hypothetical protein
MPHLTRRLRAAAIAGGAGLALVVGGVAGGASAAPPPTTLQTPTAPPASGYTYAAFVVPSAAQNGGAAYVPVEGAIDGAGSSYRLADYSVRLICNSTSFYPVNLTTFGGGSISFSSLVPISEAGHTCYLTAASAIPSQRLDFAPSQTTFAGGLLPTAVVRASARIVNRSSAGGL